MRYPIPAGKRLPVFLIMLALLLVSSWLMRGPLQTQAAPAGIVSFELAGSEAQARAILAAWDAQARSFAEYSLRLDFLFLVAYSTTIGLACLWADSVLRARGLPFLFGLPLAWAMWLAALFDAIENIALLVILHGQPQSPWPQIARWSAIPKFTLVLIGLAYVVLGALAWLATRAFGAPKTESER
jgi:hypothetical protein